MKLKPCPFCGSKDVELIKAVPPEKRFWVECYNFSCGSRTGNIGRGKWAIEAWNRRSRE